MPNWKVFTLVYNERPYPVKINVRNKSESDIELILDDLMNDIKHNRL